MQLGEIFKDALKYPIIDYTKLLIVGVILLIATLPSVLAQLGVVNETLTLVWGIISLILAIIIAGYSLSVIKNGIELTDEIPSFDWVTNFVDGIKYIVVSIVYMIIPTIIVAIVGVATGSGAINSLASLGINETTLINATNTVNIASIIPADTLNSLFVSIAVTAIVAIILYIIFGILEIVAFARLAKSGSIGDALSFGSVFNDVREIGVLKIIGWIIIAFIITVILGFIIGLISAIPYVGLIIATLVGSSFLLLFNGRALGLLYSEL